MIIDERKTHTVDVEYQRYDGVSAQDVADELIDVYAEVYDALPYIGDPFFSVESYSDRLHAAFDMHGFETVTAREEGRIIGYAHGVTLPVDQPWWLSLDDQRPPELRKAADEQHVFWLRELMIRPAYTNQGLGRQVHDMIIAGRAETATTLTCIIDNQPAHDAYLRWGYSIIGQIKHAPESPVYDAMYLAAHRSERVWMPHRAAPEPLALLDAEVRDRLAVAPGYLFVYGTLQFPAVLEALLGRIPASTPASATGWRAAALESRVYPGLVPANETADGLLLTDLSVSEWRVLDDFEDDHYELRRLRLADGRYGWAYVWPAAEVLAENWSAEDFAARHLAAYAARCAGLAAHRDSAAG